MSKLDLNMLKLEVFLHIVKKKANLITKGAGFFSFFLWTVHLSGVHIIFLLSYYETEVISHFTSLIWFCSLFLSISSGFG